MHSFVEYQRFVKKELDMLNIRCDEFKRIFDEVFHVMKTKMTEKEMKALEEIINTKIEDLKIICFSRLADKNNMNKNIKYLDAQLKHIVEVYIKKNGKG